MLFPKKVKYNKNHRLYNNRISQKQILLNHGDFGVKVMENGYITANQLESVRRVIRRYIKGVGRLWFNVFPDESLTKKPREVRMGKGVGSHDIWATFVKRGTVIVEFDGKGISKIKARSIVKSVSIKLPVKVKFIYNIDKFGRTN